jgi:hypothetical protein
MSRTGSHKSNILRLQSLWRLFNLTLDGGAEIVNILQLSNRICYDGKFLRRAPLRFQALLGLCP